MSLKINAARANGGCMPWTVIDAHSTESQGRAQKLIGTRADTLPALRLACKSATADQTIQALCERETGELVVMLHRDNPHSPRGRKINYKLQFMPHDQPGVSDEEDALDSATSEDERMALARRFMAARLSTR